MGTEYNLLNVERFQGEIERLIDCLKFSFWFSYNKKNIYRFVRSLYICMEPLMHDNNIEIFSLLHRIQWKDLHRRIPKTSIDIQSHLEIKLIENIGFLK